MMEVLRASDDEIVLGREAVGAAVLSPAERAEEGIADEPLTLAEVALLERDHAEDTAEARARALADNDLRRVEPWVQRHLVARGLATPEPSHLHRTLLRTALRVVAQAEAVGAREDGGSIDAFPCADRLTPTRVAAVLADDLRLTTLEDAFAAHAQRKRERGGWGKASVGKARVGFRLRNGLMDPIPVEQMARRTPSRSATRSTACRSIGRRRASIAA